MVQFGIKKELNDNIDLGQIVIFYRKKLLFMTMSIFVT